MPTQRPRFGVISIGQVVPWPGSGMQGERGHSGVTPSKVGWPLKEAGGGGAGLALPAERIRSTNCCKGVVLIRFSRGLRLS